MGNNMCPFTIALGEKCTYFISNFYKILENEKIEEGTLLSATNNSLDPFVYHLKKCGEDVFKTLERSQIHSCLPRFEEDDITIWREEGDDVLVVENESLIETNYCNGNNEVLEIFNQKCFSVMREIVIMHLDYVAVDIFVSNVIRIKVILIY